MIKIQNCMGGQLVCSLSDGSTLRLDPKESETVTNTKITPYLKHIGAKGYIKITEIAEKTAKK